MLPSTKLTETGDVQSPLWERAEPGGGKAGVGGYENPFTSSPGVRPLSALLCAGTCY